MSRTGMIMAAAVAIALVGAGTGVYFFLDQDQAVGIEIKDQFEVRDKHVRIMEFNRIVYEISNITKVGEDLKFDVNEDPAASDLTYDDLRDYILNEITFDASSIDAIEGDETQTSTAFGDRDCVVYTQDYGSGYKDIFYVGKNNDIIYKEEYLIDDEVVVRRVLQKSSLLLESNTDIGLKEAGEIKEGDSTSSKLMLISTLTIEKVNLSDGDAPVTYDVRISGGFLYDHMTRDEILEEAYLILPEDAENSEKGVVTERVSTPLGKVNCDVYLLTEFPGYDVKFYVSNDVLVMISGGFLNETTRIYWEYTDLVVRS